MHFLLIPKMECDCPSGGGIKNGHKYTTPPSYGGAQREKTNKTKQKKPSLVPPLDLLLVDIGPVDVAALEVEVHGDGSLHLVVVDQQCVALGQQVVATQVLAVRQQQFWLVLCGHPIRIGLDKLRNDLTRF